MNPPAPILRRRLLLGLVAVAALTGCSGTPPRLYVLTPMPPDGTVRTRANRSVAVRTVVMPEYLDRPEIVAYAGPNELSASGDDRWAERLPVNVTRVLAENLSILLGSDRVHIVPSQNGERTDCEVVVAFDRFERTVSGDSVLDAHWTIEDTAARKVVVRDRTRLSTRVADDGYPSLVVAMNENLTVLSRDIAAAIAKLPRKGGGQTQGRLRS